MPEKKGRPTPKRKEVEKSRSMPRLAPAATKEAKKLQKEQARALRAQQRAAYLRGDESALPIRDKGPVKRFVRNFVDSRRTVGEYFFYIVIPSMFLSVTPSLELRFAAAVTLYLVIIAGVAQGATLGRKAKREVKERFPDADTKGLVLYALTRAMVMRRMRAPLPQVKRGEKI